MPRTYIVQPRQTLSDAVINATGTQEALVHVAFANGISPSAYVPSGRVLVIPDDAPTNTAITSYLNANGYVLGTMGLPAGTAMESEDGDGIVNEDGEVIISED
ncbi:hypothetical protein CJD36_019820 [Flavipsychrobacter stenotrophus]|uniref:LysM domain-containing protein n=1 Tax=Flavipsychrobacter stenotrophus TaxID=2077091 RepID=A0A2S7SRF2_9BACT|nr:hypothetical protein [Flavipsychrobacter stenotrophus]PQJ09490.1 hypothetical protein CJD36_019820 [Flavipsychrobacter stenotrophus]